jgi:hypothetical protein
MSKEILGTKDGTHTISYGEFEALGVDYSAFCAFHSLDSDSKREQFIRDLKHGRMLALRAAAAHDSMVGNNPAPSVAELDSILNERGSRYGKFIALATITQILKDSLRKHLANQGRTLEADHQEALDMICHKIGRIVNGDPNYADSWIDIAGYAKLVSDKLEGVTR